MEGENVSYSNFNCGHFNQQIIIIKIWLNFLIYLQNKKISFIASEILTETKLCCLEACFFKLLSTGQGPLAKISAPYVHIILCT